MFFLLFVLARAVVVLCFLPFDHTTKTPKKVLDCINNFHTQLDEISLIVSKDSVRIKSYARCQRLVSLVMLWCWTFCCATTTSANNSWLCVLFSILLLFCLQPPPKILQTEMKLEEWLWAFRHTTRYNGHLLSERIQSNHVVLWGLGTASLLFERGGR